MAGKAFVLCALLASAAMSGRVGATEGQPDQPFARVIGSSDVAGTTAAGNPPDGRLAQRPARSGGISCVPYARMATGMAINGDGWQWWHNAAGRYSRGKRPEAGAVLTFRSSGNMSRGHVAVVDRVVGARHVLIDHANWAGPGIRRGTVMRDVSVVDVSPDNDWSAVRVQVGHDRGTFGRTYPTYGFIYNRPDPDTAFAGLPARRPATLEQMAEYPGGARAAMRPQGRAAASPARGQRQDR